MQRAKHIPRNVLLAVASSEEYKDKCQALAKQLDLPLCYTFPESMANQQCSQFHFILRYHSSQTSDLPELSLEDSSGELGGPIFVDFVAGKTDHRRRYGGGRGQPLARAIGLKGGANPTVVDATAGLGRDAFVLACLGAKVTLVERSPILGKLLEDGMLRAQTNSELSDIVNEHMELVIADAIEWLKNLDPEHYPDVIYLDPMYPHRNKSSLVKKEMRYLREIAGDDEDASQLLDTALSCARKRVVVKRPRTAPIITGVTHGKQKPGASVESKNTRYDIYLPAPSASGL
ncbi:class I SAM-dependent methyltransferase [Kaarinaea lacus]